jgi:hypothetical protein
MVFYFFYLIALSHPAPSSADTYTEPDNDNFRFFSDGRLHTSMGHNLPTLFCNISSMKWEQTYVCSYFTNASRQEAPRCETLPCVQNLMIIFREAFCGAGNTGLGVEGPGISI